MDYPYFQKDEPLHLGEITLNSPRIFLKKHEGDSLLNLQFLIDYFTPKDTGDSTPAQVITNEKVTIVNGYLEYRDLNKEEASQDGLINWNNLAIKNLNLSSSDLVIDQDTISARIDGLSLFEESGFQLDSLKGLLRYDPELVTLDEYTLQTPSSDLGGRLAFKVKKPTDFNDFVDKVRMNHTFEESIVSAKDLSYFVPDLAHLDRDIEFTGKVSGRVSNLKGKKLTIKIDENTIFKGNFSLDGLPNLDETFINLDIASLTTNREELQRIPIPPFDSGRTIRTPGQFRRTRPHGVLRALYWFYQ